MKSSPSEPADSVLSTVESWPNSDDEEDEIDAILAEEHDYDPFRLAPTTLSGVKRIFVSWQKYCKEQSQKKGRDSEKFGSATAALRNVTIDDIKRYIVWYYKGSKITKLGALFVTMRTWRLMYAQQTRTRLAEDVRIKMTDYINGFMCTRFNLRQDVGNKDVMSVDDLYNLFTTFWCTSDHWYPTERERIQHALLLLLIVYTTARPSALLATDPYEKLDNSLLYKDIRVFLVRDPQNPTKTLLLMLIKIRLNKGKRNVGTPPIFAFYETDNILAFCPILHVLALAFADRAFSSECINHLSDIDRLSVPKGLAALPLTWKPEFWNTPIMRKSVTSGETGREVSACEGMDYEDVRRMTKRLGCEAGFQPPPTLYAFRRGGGKTLDENATTAVRNQAMGHSRADIFEKYYTAQVVGADTQSAYLGTPSRSALVALAGRMSLTRDPRAQSRIKVKVEEAMKAYVDPDPDNRSRDVASMRAELIQNHGLLQNAGTTPLHTAYRAECAKRHQRRIAYKRAVEAKAREEYFVTLGDREIEEQLLGPVDEDPIAGPHFYSKERRTLAALMCSVVDVDVLSHEERVSRRFEAFHNMRALCAMVEPRPNVSRSLKRSASPSGPDESEDDGPFDAIFTSLHCPWCFYNERATKEARDTTFSKQNNLLRHIDNHHLSRRTYGADTLCPYPDCAFAPSSEAVLKNHLAKEHGRRLRKKRALATPSPSGKAHITCLPIQSFRKK